MLANVLSQAGGRPGRMCAVASGRRARANVLSQAAAMQFSLMKRSGSFKMLFSMLEEAGVNAAATAVHLIEMPDVVARPMGPLHSPVLFVCTEQMRENGTADVLIDRIPHAVVHRAEGDHFSFITKSAARISELLMRWPSSSTP